MKLCDYDRAAFFQLLTQVYVLVRFEDEPDDFTYLRTMFRIYVKESKLHIALRQITYRKDAVRPDESNELVVVPYTGKDYSYPMDLIVCHDEEDIDVLTMLYRLREDTDWWEGQFEYFFPAFEHLCQMFGFQRFEVLYDSMYFIPRLGLSDESIKTSATGTVGKLFLSSQVLKTVSAQNALDIADITWGIAESDLASIDRWYANSGVDDVVKCPALCKLTSQDFKSYNMEVSAHNVDLFFSTSFDKSYFDLTARTPVYYLQYLLLDLAQCRFYGRKLNYKFSRYRMPNGYLPGTVDILAPTLKRALERSKYDIQKVLYLGEYKAH